MLIITNSDFLLELFCFKIMITAAVVVTIKEPKLPSPTKVPTKVPTKIPDKLSSPVNIEYYIHDPAIITH